MDSKQRRIERKGQDKWLDPKENYRQSENDEEERERTEKTIMHYRVNLTPGRLVV